MPTRSPRAAGGPAALSILAGVVIGSLAGQPTIGFFIGLAVGIALLLGVWLIDRRR
jgi:hypothetical protein